uniref:Bromodomain-containing protein 4 n=1 Tax=Cajanus cajan TaxID=3821 RepID=A0A151TPC8_CAJCA|nr:Bromodomain-containing protein 4 [Cajanus cajan]
MASGPVVGGDDAAKEKQRFSERKVYTRRVAVQNSTAGEAKSNSDNVSTQPQALQQAVPEDGNLAQPLVGSKLEDGNSAQPQKIPSARSEFKIGGWEFTSAAMLVSDDSCIRQQDEPSSLHVQQEDDGPSSPSPHMEAVPSTRHLTLVNGDVERRQRDRIKINLASKSKQEMRELRWKLENELDVVRSLVNRIEVKQRQVGGYGNSNVLVGGGIDNVGGAKRAHSEVASAGVPRQLARPLHQLSLSMLENSQGIGETVEKEKRTPKANQFYRNSEFLLAKDKFPPVESNKKSKLNWKKQGGGEMGLGFGMGSKLFKSCSSLLEKLMKHKHGWVFNAPVDVEGLGLHDYFTIITHPMDLGTVKSRLNKNWYKSPKEFAEDVRLTFRNAMTYNPKGQDVHVMAEQLSEMFENRWVIIESEYNRETRYGFDYGAAPHAPSPLSRRVSAFTPPPLDMRRILDRSESLIRTQKPMSITPSSRTPAPKKPKAKDPHKRDMTFDEKQKLSTNLQSLPSEKLDAIVQIIKKRNSALNQHDDEIEVDIDSVDAETLWELDRFVTNYKKSLSKNKRKAELARARAEALQQNAIQKSQAPAMVEIPKETQTEERNVPQSFPVQGGNQTDNGSRSSSSSSSSSDSGSSSSDSDSDSSSASGSDAGSQGT